MEKQMNEIQTENRKLKDPLEKAREEVSELSRQLANYEKDKASLAVSNLTETGIMMSHTISMLISLC